MKICLLAFLIALIVVFFDQAQGAIPCVSTNFTADLKWIARLEKVTSNSNYNYANTPNEKFKYGTFQVSASRTHIKLKHLPKDPSDTLVRNYAINIFTSISNIMGQYWLRTNGTCELDVNFPWEISYVNALVNHNDR